METGNNGMTENASLETYQLQVEGHTVTVQPMYKDGVISYRISEEGKFLFILSMDEADVWKADNRQEGASETIDLTETELELAMATGSAIERYDLAN